VAFVYPLGVGYNAARPELFALYSPYQDLGTPAAHSIYFQVLGNHGFVGLFLFIGIHLNTLFTARKVRLAVKHIPQARWAADLAGMCQTALIGYAVGGAFLSLAYFDLPYYLMSLMVLCDRWVQRKGWETDPPYAPGRFSIPGMALKPDG
jgi:probable O-glycosylation ligase (exosortase A-associated)